jgi:uncharacterized protein
MAFNLYPYLKNATGCFHRVTRSRSDDRFAGVRLFLAGLLIVIHFSAGLASLSAQAERSAGPMGQNPLTPGLPLLPTTSKGSPQSNQPPAENASPTAGSQTGETSAASSASDEAHRNVVNTIPPRPEGLNIYVNDNAGLLSATDRATLQERLQALDQAGIAQVSVLILPDTDQDLSQFAPEIMNRWDIQHYKKKDGLLVLVNANRVQHHLSGNRIFVGTGYNLEGILPDAVVGRILDEQAMPAFDKGQYSQGITNATLAIAKILSGDKNLKAQFTPPSDAPDWGTLLFLLILFLIFVNFINRNRRGGGGGFFGGGGYYGGGGGGFGDGGGFSGGFGGGGDSSGGGGAGR